jgi:hypothetical protein
VLPFHDFHESFQRPKHVASIPDAHPGKAEWIGAISPIASFSSLVCADHDDAFSILSPTFGGIRPNTLRNAMAGTGQLNGSASGGARMLRTATR